MQFTRLEKARIACSVAEGTALPCEAWKHFAGGETSAELPGTTRMVFLAVFFYGHQKSALPGTRG